MMVIDLSVGTKKKDSVDKLNVNEKLKVNVVNEIQNTIGIIKIFL